MSPGVRIPTHNFLFSLVLVLVEGVVVVSLCGALILYVWCVLMWCEKLLGVGFGARANFRTRAAGCERAARGARV